MFSPSSPPVDFPPFPKEDAMSVSLVTEDTASRIVTEDTASFVALCKLQWAKGFTEQSHEYIGYQMKMNTGIFVNGPALHGKS